MNVASWLKADMQQPKIDFRFAPNSGHSEGQGVPQDYVLAHMWFSLAAAHGDEEAAQNRDLAAKRMTPADVSKAEHLAREWLEKHGKAE